MSTPCALSTCTTSANLPNQCFVLYRCHCAGLDPSAYITTEFKKIRGSEIINNNVWKAENQPPGDPGPLDCVGKRAFDIAGIYGDVNTVSGHGL